MALAIWRKADHSACILLDIAAVQVSCFMHKEAHWQRSAVMNWCSQDLVRPPINNKLGTSTHWWLMFLFLQLILCMACRLCHIYHQHNQNWKTVMCITLGSTRPFYTSNCWWSNKHQWLFSYKPCHWKMLFSEEYHTSTPWYCISSSSVVTNEYTQRKWSEHV